MKKQIFNLKNFFVIILFVVCSPLIGLSQSSFNNQSGRIIYTKDSLNTLNKLDLTKIYLQQVQTLNNILPYASFNIKGQASGVKQIDIPKSKYTSSKREKVSDKGKNYNETMNENLNEIIPYSDKNEIIKGILFVQEMINRLDQGL